MPQFIMPLATRDQASTFNALSEFERGYIEAAFFTECHGDNPELEHASFGDLAPDTLQKMRDDCTDFLASAEPILETLDTYSDEQAGHDFWFTRNGHGAGFWDRGLGEPGDKLTKLAKPYGSFDLYRGDDGKVYGC